MLQQLQQQHAMGQYLDTNIFVGKSDHSNVNSPVTAIGTPVVPEVPARAVGTSYWRELTLFHSQQS